MTKERFLVVPDLTNAHRRIIKVVFFNNYAEILDHI